MEEYYFKVTFDRGLYTHVLVKAKDIIEAGKKAEMACLSNWHKLNGCMIVEITRTDIQAVID